MTNLHRALEAIGWTPRHDQSPLRRQTTIRRPQMSELYASHAPRCTQAAWRTALDLCLAIDTAVIDLNAWWPWWPWPSGITMRWQSYGEDEDLWIHGITPTWEWVDGTLWATVSIDRRGRVVQ